LGKKKDFSGGWSYLPIVPKGKNSGACRPKGRKARAEDLDKRGGSNRRGNAVVGGKGHSTSEHRPPWGGPPNDLGVRPVQRKKNTALNPWGECKKEKKKPHPAGA